MAGVPKPLTDEEIEARLAELPKWNRDGDEIHRRVDIRYHAGVAMIVHIADRERRIGHHADINLRIDHLHIAVTTHDADYKLTEVDFDLAARIDAIAEAHQATPLD
ncbi:4a-hydroxytetrahydrobiopterin dehydratase [Streptomyces sp. NBC_00893]|uniref:4a-hydroxytetrahydrobiopterin dehydratase n=1 Tax=Streptomyces sp. NBC_00893 TaxID=2975862 RepID=UPI0022559928|nr:4a-hydroxytetrahydrobiopterin dehydratase [Streptomyces sp. NBC_00893]MCX4847958.1 4a-hydroxytetrahydrobiopterin dehydratase [Streptomyces sp. NBC_00893]